MKNEPSVLLIDDDNPHYDCLCGMGLDKEEDAWEVKGAISKDIDEAYKKAYDMIKDQDGFTVILLDIKWFYDKDDYDSYAGLKILQRLYKTSVASPICRKVMIVTKADSIDAPDPILTQLTQINLSITQIPYVFETEYGRDGIKKCLLDFWQQVRPKK